MRRDPRVRTTAVAALLLSATAVATGTGTGTAHAAGTTDVVFEVVDGVLALAAGTADATPNTTVTTTQGQAVVESELGTVTVTDTRIVQLGWRYSAGVPHDFEPVKGKVDQSPRAGGKAASRTGTQFRITSAPQGDGSATFQWKSAWTTVNPSGVAADLVVRSTLGTSTKTTFNPEMKIVLPADTEPGAYKAQVTHSVS